MSGLLARRAYAADLDEVLRLLNEASVWLASKGLDQWGRGFGPERIGPLVKAGRTFVVVPVNGGPAVATVSVSPEADQDFWTLTEQATPAWYVSKLATSRDARRGLGALLLRWVLDRADASGVGTVRLDVWKTNRELHDWYLRQGWRYLRTVDAPGRFSGALFEHQAEPDLLAQQTFAGRPKEIERLLRGELAAGTRVVTDDGERGTVTVVEQPRTGNEVGHDADAYPARHYWVDLDSGETVVLSDMQVEVAI